MKENQLLFAESHEVERGAILIARVRELAECSILGPDDITEVFMADGSQAGDLFAIGIARMIMDETGKALAIFNPEDE